MPPSEQNETAESCGLGEGQQRPRSRLCAGLLEGGRFPGVRALRRLTRRIHASARVTGEEREAGEAKPLGPGSRSVRGRAQTWSGPQGPLLTLRTYLAASRAGVSTWAGHLCPRSALFGALPVPARCSQSPLSLYPMEEASGAGERERESQEC